MKRQYSSFGFIAFFSLLVLKFAVLSNSPWKVLSK